MKGAAPSRSLAASDRIPTWMSRNGSSFLNSSKKSGTKEEHFEACCGDMVRIRFIRGENGEKELSAILRRADKDGITVETESGEEKKYPLTDIAYVKLYMEFE